MRAREKRLDETSSCINVLMINIAIFRGAAKFIHAIGLQINQNKTRRGGNLWCTKRRALSAHLQVAIIRELVLITYRQLHSYTLATCLKRVNTAPLKRISRGARLPLFA